ncbi:hypothetical protein L596_006184 [Steinernema carpocapsae]|uniref:GSKIP domain-containing protein n=1 Tax=Steinernema carpocapsae TaxID=34508 RepID=A0A4U8V1C4_STECR|nr:hypothetical protein L596_006184 [Steinernema carpocapsae]
MANRRASLSVEPSAQSRAVCFATAAAVFVAAAVEHHFRQCGRNSTHRHVHASRRATKRVQEETGSNVCSPISLEDIAAMNRKRHAAYGGKMPNHEGGPLELEAIAAVHELAPYVQAISVSEMLPRTADLIFVNVKTFEGHPYTLELTMKGWRIASSHTDSMNGDYTNIELHIKYYENAKLVLDFLSPNHACRFNHCLTERLNQLKSHIDQNDEEKGIVTDGNENHIVRMVIEQPPETATSGEEGELIFEMHHD